MSLKLSSEELLEILEGRLAVGMLSDRIGAIKTDTRAGVTDSWFLALPGAKYDGHDFIGEAFSSGAIGCIVNERTGYPIADTSFPLVAVDDTMLAYSRLANNWRKRLNFKVVSIVSEDRKQSSDLFLALQKKLESREEFEFESIDLRLMRVEHALETILKASLGLSCLLVNLVPENLYDATLMIEALSADVLTVVGKPFGYLRLFEDQKKVEEASNLMYSSVRKQSGSLIWASSEALPLSLEGEKECRIFASSVNEETDKKSENIDMMPVDQFSEIDLQWCIETTLEEI